ncbi:MAG: recombination protein RecR [Spirochaetia bacterium]|nr:recombination protein RecR [Spirochaetia bacterium]
MQLSSLDNVVHLLSALPGIGRRSAQRIAFYLLKTDPSRVEQLCHALLEMRRSVRFCSQCGSLSETELCSICRDPARDQKRLCVVEEPGDIFSIETTGEYRGLYHVLMGALSPLDGIGPEDLRLRELRDRLSPGQFTELFVATNPTLEGDATAHYILELARRPGLTITRISHGIATGASIEFAEQGALARSIRDRRPLGG